MKSVWPGSISNICLLGVFTPPSQGGILPCMRSYSLETLPNLLPSLERSQTPSKLQRWSNLFNSDLSPSFESFPAENKLIEITEYYNTCNISFGNWDQALQCSEQAEEDSIIHPCQRIPSQYPRTLKFQIEQQLITWFKTIQDKNDSKKEHGKACRCKDPHLEELGVFFDLSQFFLMWTFCKWQRK